MRLARRAHVIALAMLILCAAASAQTLRNENDPRNIAPTVGTGGPMGGPTGLFTIYDGQTLRRGEFTFSIAYSNFDRDPGNVDLTEVPISFQIGVGDHLELFFNTDAYRGIKVNNPKNLSSFYLPNSRLYTGPGTLTTGPAIILAPNGLTGFLTTAVFRPTGIQPFVQYPFTFTSSTIIPGRTISFGAVNTPGGGSNFGSADAFPGIGSPVGSILPGVVLASNFVTLFGGTVVEVPATFTVAPAYLPDAPFINRLYGQSAFSTFTVGAKWRWTGPNNPFGFGFIPFYRFYGDQGDDSSGFNQLQRGASPGGSIGDFGLVMFADGRLSRSVNVSANLGYILNSNPRGTFPGGEFTLLDRPDEFIAGVGFDFPINKHFQPIFELRSTQYVGGRTPNAFENSPVEALGGIRIYPKRWMGFSLAYRYHINQQDRQQFEGRDVTTVVNLGGGATQAIPVTVGSFPRGFNPSEDAHGFLFQFFIGRRNERAPEFLPNQAPTVSIAAAESSITLACPAGTRPTTCTAPSPDFVVNLTTNASDPDGDTLLYTYTTTGGRITGEGANVSWDLSGAQPGTYTATVEVDDGCGCVSFSSTTVTVSEPPAGCCVPPCPDLSVSCPTDLIEVGGPATVTANVSGGDPNASITYNWTVSGGSISGGQGTPSITVDTTGLTGGGSVTATVEIGGVAPECNRTASCTFTIRETRVARKFDEYGNIAFNDEKARLDNFAIELQNDPGAQGYIIAYSGRRARANEAQSRADRAKDYLVNMRQIDSGRIVTVDGGAREDLTVELWIVPSGAAPPTASPTVDASEVQIIRAPARRSRRGRRR